MAAGLEEAGVIGRMAAKERAEEAMKNLQESARILQVDQIEDSDLILSHTYVSLGQVEPDMKEVVQGRLAAVSSLLAKWEE